MTSRPCPRPCLLLALVSALLWPVRGHAQAGVRVTGAPRTYQVVTIPAPAALPPGTALSFEVVPSGAFPILGAGRGVLPQGGGGGRNRAITMTIGVPADAPAGRREAARVRFATPTDTVVVAVQVDVSRVRRASLIPVQRLLAARQGQLIELRYRLTNAGNAPDSLVVRTTVPPRWAHVPAREHVLLPDGTIDGVVVVGVPRDASTGSTQLGLVVTGQGADTVELARVDASIEVLDELNRRSGDLWQITPSVAAVFGDSTPAVPVFGLQFEGRVADGVRAYGRLAQSGNLGAGQLWGLARLGYFPGANYLSLAASRWRLSGGNASMSFSDITGVNLWGHGAAFTYGGPRWTTSLLAAQPAGGLAAMTTGGGHLFGAQVGLHVGSAWVRGTATDALETQALGRRLQAVGFGATSPPLLFGTLVSGEIVARRFATGQGVGWLAEAKGQRDEDHWLVRYAHAPGGGAAFASARDMLVAYGSRRVAPRVIVGGGYWTSQDTSAAFSRLNSSGWSLRPVIGLSERATLEIEARSNRFDARGVPGDFGSSETVGRVGLTTRLGRLVGTASAQAGQATRTTAFAGGGVSAATAGRFGAQGSLQWVSPLGVLGANASYDQNGPGVGYLPRQYVVELRADGVPLPNGSGAVLNAGVQRYEWFGARPSATVVHFGVRAPFPGYLVVTLDAQRNPLFLASTSGSSWNVALKLEHRMAVLARSAVVDGVVYEDRNANGRLDHGEPVVAGAVVRRDGESALTDTHGRFRFFREAEVAAVLDESSLPFGLVANPAARPRAADRHVAIGVIPMAPVTVRLVLTGGGGGPGGVVSSVDLRDAILRARDEQGNLWSARADSAGVAVFHALPPGDYRLEVDLSRLKEPLLLQSAPPGFRVESGRPVPTLTIPVAPRPIRLFQPGQPESDP